MEKGKRLEHVSLAPHLRDMPGIVDHTGSLSSNQHSYRGASEHTRTTTMANCNRIGHHKITKLRSPISLGHIF